MELEREGGVQSNTLAFKYYKKAYKLNDANGCQYLAEMYKRGKGTQKDISLAKQLYKKVCKLGNKSVNKEGSYESSFYNF